MNEAIVVLAITMSAFLFSRNHLTTIGFSKPDYWWRCGAWLLINLAVFASVNYWLYAILCCAILLLASRKDSNPVALFCFLLFAVPSHQVIIPGPGPIDTLIEINYYRMLAIFLLLPIAWQEFTKPAASHARFRVPDFLVVVLALWMVGAAATDSGSLTITIRKVVYAFLDVIIPYYATSRYITNSGRFNDVAAAFVAALFVLALIAIFEANRGWLLYEWTSAKWVGWSNSITVRGVLRATGPLMTPIGLGFCLVVGLAFTWMLRQEGGRSWQHNFIFLVIFIGLLATVSRGPWVGAVVFVVALSSIGPGKFMRLSLLAVAGGLVTTVLLLSPWGEAFISYLPWIGTNASNTVTFRENLLQDALTVISENPWFGDQEFGLHPLMLRQAAINNNFLDIANTYLGYALLYGLIAVLLFVLIIGTSLLRLRRVVKEGFRGNNQLVGEARVMFAMVFAMAVMFGTTSMISVMSNMYWTIVGIVSALYCLSQAEKELSTNKGFSSVRVAG